MGDEKWKHIAAIVKDICMVALAGLALWQSTEARQHADAGRQAAIAGAVKTDANAAEIKAVDDKLQTTASALNTSKGSP